MNGSTKPNLIICLFKKNINEKFRNSLRQIFTKISQHEFTDDFPNFQLENIKKFVFDFDIQKCQITLETLQQQPQQNSNETALNNANNNICKSEKIFFSYLLNSFTSRRHELILRRNIISFKLRC